MAVQQAAGADPYFPEHGDPRYRVHRYELALDYRPGPNRLSGTARINAIAGRAPLTEFVLNLADFRIGRVRVDGRQPHYTHRGGRLRVRRAERPVTLLHTRDHDYYRILRSKLHWGRGGHLPGAQN